MKLDLYTKHTAYFGYSSIAVRLLIMSWCRFLLREEQILYGKKLMKILNNSNRTNQSLICSLKAFTNIDMKLRMLSNKLLLIIN